jgi:hypothetical protein
MGRFVILSEERDIPILQFIWKWKLATTAALYFKFFPGRAPTTAHNRMHAIYQGGFLDRRTDNRGQRFLWCLGKKGFEAIRDQLPELQEVGYMSEHIKHDHLVAAAHLGEWLLGIPEGVEILSEQEIRRFESSFLPIWYPAYMRHRADGYWYMKNGESERIIALEVELAHKRSADYVHAGDSYGQYRTIEVLWIVESKGLAHSIRIGTNKHREKPRPDILNFVLLSDFLSRGWQAKIFHGQGADLTIASFLGKSPTKVLQNSPVSLLTMSLIDGRRFPFASGAYKKQKMPTFSE